MRHPTEECDDNDTGSGDGCSASCTIENMWSCTGGSVSSRDYCNYCSLGTSPSPTKDQCLVTCGDGLKHSTEECEDSNIDSDDGCTSTCTIEDDYICTGGTTTSDDTCTKCGGGVSPNVGKDT